eukprot:GEMP01123004.1.p1 GENE.GEMP01123004.1~~GEMP01123004.1.p1  ORF type:complete len:112 (+),score=42.92 GEMP01123004.1:24-359(+)
MASLKYAAAYLLAVTAGKDVKKGDLEKILTAVGIEFDGAVADKLISELSGKTIHEVIAGGRDKLKNFGGGGAPAAGGAAACGGGAAAPAAAAAAAPVEEEEEEEMEFDLFG